MLEMEKNKARKKIDETRKRTEEIRALKLKNDIKYQQEILSEAQRSQISC